VGTGYLQSYGTRKSRSWKVDLLLGAGGGREVSLGDLLSLVRTNLDNFNDNLQVGPLMLCYTNLQVQQFAPSYSTGVPSAGESFPAHFAI